MPFEVVVIERRPVPDGQRFWDRVADLLKRVSVGTAAKMQTQAPVGKTGKLARRVDVRVSRVNQGFVQGVALDFIVAVPYGHLIARGHRIVARGEQRKGLRLSKGERAMRRSALLERRSRGSLGFVPANPFASATLQEDQGAIAQGIEQGLTDAV
jgi:hypothetical protein